MKKRKPRWAKNRSSKSRQPSGKKTVDEIAPEIVVGGVNGREAASYLANYILHYRYYFHNYLSAPLPNGLGYPPLIISPYLLDTDFFCYLAKDGAAIAVYSGLDDDAPEFLPKFKWKSEMEDVTGSSNKLNGKIKIRAYDIELENLVHRITGRALPHLFANTEVVKWAKTFFWNPFIIRNMTFANADKSEGRHYSYLEVVFHVEKAAWDTRNLYLRVLSDLRRDFAYTVSGAAKQDGSISYSTSYKDLFYERLHIFKQAIDDFEQLLNNNPHGDERLFHHFIESNRIILDVYAEDIVSKPKFHLPEGESLQGKKYVEPDFVIKYPGDSYKLVEIEKPGKSISTQKGHTSQEFNQSAYQTKEWDYYIRNHHEQIKDRFPNINNHHSYLVIISRQKQFENDFAGRSLKQYKAVIASDSARTEFMTYDEMLEKAKQAYRQLMSLGVPADIKPPETRKGMNVEMRVE